MRAKTSAYTASVVLGAAEQAEHDDECVCVVAECRYEGDRHNEAGARWPETSEDHREMRKKGRQGPEDSGSLRRVSLIGNKWGLKVRGLGRQ